MYADPYAMYGGYGYGGYGYGGMYPGYGYGGGGPAGGKMGRGGQRGRGGRGRSRPYQVQDHGENIYLSFVEFRNDLYTINTLSMKNNSVLETNLFFNW